MFNKGFKQSASSLRRWRNIQTIQVTGHNQIKRNAVIGSTCSYVTYFKLKIQGSLPKKFQVATSLCLVIEKSYILLWN